MSGGNYTEEDCFDIQTERRCAGSQRCIINQGTVGLVSSGGETLCHYIQTAAYACAGMLVMLMQLITVLMV